MEVVQFGTCAKTVDLGLSYATDVDCDQGKVECLDPGKVFITRYLLKGYAEKEIALKRQKLEIAIQLRAFNASRTLLVAGHLLSCIGFNLIKIQSLWIG